jgi:hypothetical protein
MPEFIFACPECRQQVQCDPALAGSPIICPLCQRTIAVPPAAEPTIQIKISTLRRLAFITAGVAAVFVLVMLALYFLQPRRVIFKASVDGTDVVKISGDRLWIEHQSWQLPTLIHVNGVKWDPEWNGNTSENYELRRAFRPGSPDAIKLTKVHGRGGMSIIQMPSPANHQTLAIQLDDGSYGGAAFYEFILTW